MLCFSQIYHLLDDRFLKFCLAVEDFVQDRNLLNVPQNVWKPFCYAVTLNFVFATFTFVAGISCFALGLFYSTYYTRINCDDGINIWIPLNNLIATWTGFFAIKALHIRWSAFVHLVFTVTMTPMMMFAALFSITQISVWFEEQRLTRGGKDWGTVNAYINVVIAILTLINVTLSFLIVGVYCKYWLPTNYRTQAAS